MCVCACACVCVCARVCCSDGGVAVEINGEMTQQSAAVLPPSSSRHRPPRPGFFFFFSFLYISIFFLSSRGLRPPEALVKEGNYRLQTFNNEPLSSPPSPPPSSPLTPTHPTPSPPFPPPSPLCLSGFLGGHCILMSISNFSCLLSCLTPLIHQYIIRDKVLWTPAAVTR